MNNWFIIIMDYMDDGKFSKILQLLKWTQFAIFVNVWELAQFRYFVNHSSSS